jgi:hypothetical protein
MINRLETIRTSETQLYPSTVSFKLTPIDMLRGNLYALPRSLAMQLLAALIVIASAWQMYRAVQDLDSALLVKILTFIILEVRYLFVIGLVLAILLPLAILVMNLPSQNRTIMSEQQVIVSPDNFVTVTRYYRTECQWAAIEKLGQDRNLIYIYLSQSAACIIPKRVFQSKTEADQFFAFLADRRQAARRA